MNWSDGCGGDTTCQVEIISTGNWQCKAFVGRNEYMRTEKHDYDDDDDDADDDAFRCVFFIII
jgi:hypothetical protein